MKAEYKSNNIPFLFNSLLEKIEGEIDCSYEVTSNHSLDNSPFSIKPLSVIYPKTINDIREIIIFSKENNVPITPCGFRLCENGGSLTDGIQIDMTRYINDVMHINALDKTIEVMAGAKAKDIKNKLSGFNLEIPIITDENEDSSIGGLVANKEISGTSLAYGSIREWVVGLNIILQDGNEYKIEEGVTQNEKLLLIHEKISELIQENDELISEYKSEAMFNTSLYNIWNHNIGMNKLIDIIVGSQGTLGIITKIKLKTEPKTTTPVSIAVTIDSYSLLNNVVNIFNNYNTVSIFYFDETVFELNKEYKNYIVKNLITTEDYPITIVGSISANNIHDLKHKINVIFNLLPVEESKKKVLDDNEIENYKIIIKENKELLNTISKNQGLTPISLTNDIVLPIKHLSDFVKDVNNILTPNSITYTITGNIGFGQLSITPLINLNAKNENLSIFKISKDIFELVKKYNGSISGSMGDGLSKSPYLPIIYNTKIINICEEIKNIFDPENIFNPKKKFNVDLSYLKQHLKNKN